MEPTEFREAMEQWARDTGVPVSQVLEVIEDVGQRSLVELKERGKEAQRRFLYANYHLFRVARLPPDQIVEEARRVPHPSELKNQKIEILSDTQ